MMLINTNFQAMTDTSPTFEKKQDITSKDTVSSEKSTKQEDRVTLSHQGIEASKSVSDIPYSLLSHSELAEKRKSILLNMGRMNEKEVEIADKEIPSSDDPKRIAQAKQATDYLYYRDSSPFSGYSRKELITIIYDDSGAYTSNERTAALRQQQTLDTEFWGPLAQEAERSADYREFFKMALVFYDQLSPIEKSAYPVDYKMQINNQLQHANNKKGEKIDDDIRETLLDMICKLDQAKNEKNSSASDESI